MLFSEDLRDTERVVILEDRARNWTVEGELCRAGDGVLRFVRMEFERFLFCCF